MIVKRSKSNPVLKPNSANFWEGQAVFNGSPAKKGRKIYLTYRALSVPHYHATTQFRMSVSDIGIAESTDGIEFSNRRRFIVPQEPWDKFGCEDPRVTEIDGTYYTFYTALSGYPFSSDNIKVGVALSKDLKTITERHLVTPFNAKAMTLFPEKINGKFWALLSVNTDRPPSKICVRSFDMQKDIWSKERWNVWYKNFEKFSLPLARTAMDQVEVGAAPIKTKHGWLVIYSHIRNYFTDHKIFGIEAVLLDLKNPQKIVARTNEPILVPQEYYEKIGSVPNIVFPSGAFLEGDWIHLYYGAADTTVSLAHIKLSSLVRLMLQTNKVTVKRSPKNPIIAPRKGVAWESTATFNPGAIELGGKIHILYRAMSADNTSVFGYASSKDGVTIDTRSADPIYVPRESFEQKLTPNGNSGCEDPRLVKVADKIYMTYTAFDGKNPPRIALTSISTENFLEQKWLWSKPVVISPSNLDDKDAFVFPEKVDGKYLIIHRYGESIDYALASSLSFSSSTPLEENLWITRREGWWDSKKVGAAAPPIKTKAGWVMLYHGVSDEGVYRVGAVLLDLKNPLNVIGRTDHPILEPETPYEKTGIVSNVVFPCGAVLKDGTLFIYYGAADKVCGVATLKMDDLIETLLADSH